MESFLCVSSIVPGIFGNQQNQHIDSIKQMLHSCLIDQSNAQVCVFLAVVMSLFDEALMYC